MTRVKMTRVKMTRDRVLEKVSFLGSYTQGQFRKNAKGPLIEHSSPGDFTDPIFSWSAWDPQHLDSVVEAGQEAHQKWSRLCVSERLKRLEPLRAFIQKKQQSWAQIISRETGKPLWESEAEVRALLAKWDFFSKRAGDRLASQEVLQGALRKGGAKDIKGISQKGLQEEAKARLRFKSRGLVLVIGPFNFPMHLPFGQILPALIAGNTVIFKGSEKTPASSQELARAFDSLALKPGIFQMIPGGARVSKKLCLHKGLDGVFFTGSFKVGQSIKKALLEDYSKLLVLEMGGYNSTLVWESANIDWAVSESLKSCFWTAGQRCTSTSQIIVHKKIAGEFINKFIKASQALHVGPWYDNPFMGSVISADSVKRFFTLQKAIQKAGGGFLLPGQAILKDKGFYVRPGIYQLDFDKESALGQEESFTPQVIIYECQSLDRALEIIHHSGYGLSLSIFTGDIAIKEELFYRAKVGLLNWNLASTGASSYLPFGGLGKSGNDRPAGSWALDFCVSPLSEREKQG